MDDENFDNSIPSIEYCKHITNAPNWFVEAKRTSCTELIYITGGNAVYTINRQKYLVEEGDVLCIPKGAERAASSNEPATMECFVTGFFLYALTGDEVTLPLPLHSRVGVQNDLIAYYRRLCEDMISKSTGFKMRSRARLMLVIQRLMEMLVYDADTYRLDTRIKQALRFTAENYAEHITVASVAYVVSLNPVYFGTLFKRETGVSFREHLNTVRMNQAEQMLRAGKWNVTEVATNCGFTDVFYFSRLFKKYKGIPPSMVQG